MIIKIILYNIQKIGVFIAFNEKKMEKITVTVYQDFLNEPGKWADLEWWSVGVIFYEDSEPLKIPICFKSTTMEVSNEIYELLKEEYNEKTILEILYVEETPKRKQQNYNRESSDFPDISLR